MIVQSITLDLSENQSCPYIYAKQGDSQSRNVRVKLTNGGADYQAQGITANLRARKPDGTMVLNPAVVNDDGTITLELTSQVLAVPGSVLADVCLCGSGGEILSTVSFVICVEPAPMGEQVDSANELLALTEMMERVEGSLVVDKSLTQPDRAADAKTVGDAIAVERARINQLASLEEGGTTGDAELQDIRIGHDGTEYSTAGEAVRAVGAHAAALAQFRYVPDSSVYDRKAINLVEDGCYSMTKSQWDDLPGGDCVLLTYRYSVNYIVQLAIGQKDGHVYSRIIHREDRTIYRDWQGLVPMGGGAMGSGSAKFYVPDRSAVLSFNVGEQANGGAGIWLFGVNHGNKSLARIQVFDTANSAYRAFDIRADGTVKWNGYNIPTTVPVLDPSAYDRLTTKVTTPGYYVLNALDWDDLPLNISGAMLVFHYSTNYVVQIVISTVTGNILTRIVHRTTFEVYREWAAPSGLQPVRVLALGDSICAGYRNSGKGFVGDLGLPYKNIGFPGATISNKNPEATNVPDQLVELTGYDPDVIIANGGINDYFYDAEMGALPQTPVTTQAAAEALDRSTVLGGLQYLLYQMIARYPKAQRFFLLTHKTTRNGVDYTVTANDAGYTQTELFDAIKKVCALYGVKIIDVFGESMINTAFPAYVSGTSYDADNTVTNREFVDSDGVHPLAYGYLHGYIPIVRQALGIGTMK